MPDETTNTDAPVVAEVSVDPIVAEPASSVAVEQPIVVETQVAPEPASPVSVLVEPVVEAHGLGASEESSATRVDAFPGASLSEDIDSPAIPESVQAPEQPAGIAQPSVSAPVDDLVSTPQTVQFEALKPEIIPEMSPAEPIVEQTHIAPEPTKILTQPAPATVHTIVQPVQLQNIFRSLIAKGRATIQAGRRKKIDRIMGLFAKQTNITNDDIEKLLHISDATASRYLGILEKENKIKQVGTAGRWVSYTRA